MLLANREIGFTKMAGLLLSQTQQQRLQMVLAPQLRQSLELLQVPVLELQAMVQKEIQENPTLEEKLQAEDPVEIEPSNGEEENPAELEFKEEYEILSRLDDEWKDYFRQSQTTYQHSAADEARREFFLNSISQTVSLQEHLLNQLSLAELEDGDRRIGEMLVGSINDDGYLTTTLAEMSSTTGYTIAEIDAVLKVIQDFDPVGIGAADLRSCLLLQLARLGKADSPLANMVTDHLPLLGARKYPDIARAMKLSVEDVQDMARFVATLEPRPGRMFNTEAASYVLPEVTIQKLRDEYVVFVSDKYLPHLRISRHYRKLMKDPSTPPDVKEYILKKIQSGSFLIKSIHQRQQTIHRIATEIVNAQRAFFDEGLKRLKPLTMAAVADKLGIHETTVSRAVANKYAQTPQGTFELKYFFTPGYNRADGEAVSNATIKDALAQMVAQEKSQHPLSDQAIVEKLKEQGIKVARRTIAKYRDQLHILPSHLRKSY